MQNEFELNFPNSFGHIEFENNRGTFTVAVKDIEKKPVRGLKAENFILQHRGNPVDDLELSEQIAGVYSLSFAIDASHLEALKLGGRQIKPYEIMLTVRQGDRSSGNRLVLLF